MPRIQPLIPLLRPLAAPRRAGCQQLFRFTTASRLRIEPSSEAPSPARAADLAAAEASTDADSAQSPAPKPVLPSKRPQSNRPQKPNPVQDALSSAFPPKPKKPKKSRTPAGQTQIQLPPPKYHVARSTSKNLPIYTDYKRGGNLHLTTIRKITGDLTALRDELRVFLNKKNEDVKINSLTQHVVIKGHHVPEVTEFLRARGM